MSPLKVELDAIIANRRWASDILAGIPGPMRVAAMGRRAIPMSPPQDTLWSRLETVYTYSHLNPDHMLMGFRMGVNKSGSLCSCSFWPANLYHSSMVKLLRAWENGTRVLHILTWVLDNLTKPHSEISLMRNLSFLMGSAILLEVVEAPSAAPIQESRDAQHSPTAADPNRRPAVKGPPRRSGALIQPA